MKFGTVRRHRLLYAGHKPNRLIEIWDLDYLKVFSTRSNAKLFNSRLMMMQTIYIQNQHLQTHFQLTIELIWFLKIPTHVHYWCSGHLTETQRNVTWTLIWNSNLYRPPTRWRPNFKGVINFHHSTRNEGILDQSIFHIGDERWLMMLKCDFERTFQCRLSKDKYAPFIHLQIKSIIQCVFDCNYE